MYLSEATGDTRYLLATSAPHYALVVASSAPRATSGFTSATFASTDYFTTRITSTGAQGSWVEWDVLLAAGTYTLTFYQRLAVDNGIYTVSVDGVDVGAIDGYNAGGGSTPAPVQLQGIAVATGQHRVRFTMATKNASASGYLGRFSGFALTEATNF